MNLQTGLKPSNSPWGLSWGVERPLAGTRGNERELGGTAEIQSFEGFRRQFAEPRRDSFFRLQTFRNRQVAGSSPALGSTYLP